MTLFVFDQSKALGSTEPWIYFTKAGIFFRRHSSVLKYKALRINNLTKLKMRENRATPSHLWHGSLLDTFICVIECSEK